MEQQSQIQKPKKKLSKRLIIVTILIIIAVLGWAGLTRAGFIQNYLGIPFLNFNNNDNNDIFSPEANCPPGMFCKPLIYLYPIQKQEINIKIDFKGELTNSYPRYNNGWKVTAYPDGKIVNSTDSKVYSYLFWEGKPKNLTDWNISNGFIVKGKDTKNFLQNILIAKGLNVNESNDFIEYWYPQMKNNKYNLIHFADEQYIETATLSIVPKPDSILRVFMVFKPLDEKIIIMPQEIKPFKRNGYTVVEWGGTEIN
jgi:hypothetical protein